MRKLLISLAFVFSFISIILSAYNSYQIDINKGEGLFRGTKEYGEYNSKSHDVSIINLISTPEKYDKLPVRVVGVIYVDYNRKEDGSTIYISKDDYKYVIPMNGVYISINFDALKADYNELKKFNGKYVVIEGIFHKDYPYIDNVSMIRYYEDLMFKHETI